MRDVGFDPACPRVAESISQRFARDPVDFVAQNRTQTLWRAYHRDLECRRLPRDFCGGELHAQLPDGLREVRAEDVGGADVLDRIPTLRDCPIRGLASAIPSVNGL